MHVPWFSGHSRWYFPNVFDQALFPQLNLRRNWCFPEMTEEVQGWSSYSKLKPSPCHWHACHSWAVGNAESPLSPTFKLRIHFHSRDSGNFCVDQIFGNSVVLHTSGFNYQEFSRTTTGLTLAICQPTNNLELAISWNMDVLLLTEFAGFVCLAGNVFCFK